MRVSRISRRTVLSGLFQFCSRSRNPFAVFWRVALFYVECFQATGLEHNGWPHVSHEVGRKSAPPVANSMPCPIPGVAFIGRVVATAHHCVVAVIKRRIAFAMRGIGFGSGESRWRAFARHYFTFASAIGRNALARLVESTHAVFPQLASTDQCVRETSFASCGSKQSNTRIWFSEITRSAFLVMQNLACPDCEMAYSL